jgi:sugar lactone lactonase YvrE
MNAEFTGALRVLVALVFLGLGACHGGSGPGPVTIGGTVSGLAGSGLVLTDNGSDHLAVPGNGSFTFATRIPAGSAYSVGVLTQPTSPSQTCTVTNASGNAGAGTVSTVAVVCSTNSYRVGGTVTGLAGSGLVLLDNGSDALSVSVDGTFTFATLVASGAAYSVSVQAQPTNPSQACNISGGGGAVDATDVATIAVVCTSHILRLFAGNLGGPGNADGIGPAARFVSPEGIATDTAGNVYVADIYNYTIRKITPAGVVTTLAGTAGVRGSADGIGATAQFVDPTAVATDSAGNVYVADTAFRGAVIGSNTIRKITPAGVVTTLADTAGVWGSADGIGAAAQFSSPGGIATDAAGNVYVADSLNYTIRKITPAGVVTTLAGTAGAQGSADGVGVAARFTFPDAIVTDTAGNLYVADGVDNTIRKITPAGVVTTLAGTAGTRGSADGIGAAAQFYSPAGIATDTTGNVYVADTLNYTIRKITPAGAVTTLAGTAGVQGSADGTGAAAQFIQPFGVATDTAGNVYAADFYNFTIRRITPAGIVTTLAGAARVEGYVDGIAAAARFTQPSGVATDTAGNVYVADQGNSVIRKITPAGVVTTLAGGVPGTADGIGAAAQFAYPLGVATDSTGNVYVADTRNNTIRKITPAGVVTTLAGTAEVQGSADGMGIAAQFNQPDGVATDLAGNIYVSDAYNSTIRKITPIGAVTTLAGTAGVSGHADGVGAAAEFFFPEGIATDTAGYVYVADTRTIRKISPAGVVTTLAGTAGINDSLGLATDTAGNLYIADTGNSLIRKIAPNGVVSTIVGVPGQAGFTAGALPGVIQSPQGIAISGTSLYISLYQGIAVVQDLP